MGRPYSARAGSARGKGGAGARRAASSKAPISAPKPGAEQGSSTDPFAGWNLGRETQSAPQNIPQKQETDPFSEWKNPPPSGRITEKDARDHFQRSRDELGLTPKNTKPSTTRSRGPAEREANEKLREASERFNRSLAASRPQQSKEGTPAHREFDFGYSKRSAAPNKSSTQPARGSGQSTTEFSDRFNAQIEEGRRILSSRGPSEWQEQQRVATDAYQKQPERQMTQAGRRSQTGEPSKPLRILSPAASPEAYQQDSMKEERKQKLQALDEERKIESKEWDEKIKAAQEQCPNLWKFRFGLLLSAGCDVVDWLGLAAIPGIDDIFPFMYNLVVLKGGLWGPSVELLSDIGDIIPGLNLIGYFFDALPLNFISTWSRYSAVKKENRQAYAEVERLKAGKRAAMEKKKAQKAQVEGKKYSGPSSIAGLLFVLLILTTIAVAATGIAPVGSPVFMILALALVVILFMSLMGFVSLSIDERIIWDVLQVGVFVAFILAFYIFAMPRLQVCLFQSDQCKEALEQGIVTADIQASRWGKYLNPVAWYERQLAQAGFSGAGEAENSRVGVQLKLETKLRSGENYHLGSTMYLYGTLTSTEFAPIMFVPYCELRDGNKPVSIGRISPKTVNLQTTKEVPLTCTIEPPEDKGAYAATLGGAMNGITNAYVTFTFVSEKTFLNYQARGMDINKEMGIEPNIKPLYTKGPVTVKFEKMSQPIALKTDKSETFPLNILLDANWTEGTVEQVSIDISLPPEMTLTETADCQGWGQPTPSRDGYQTYTISADKMGDFRTGIRVLSCEVEIPDPEKLLLNQEKTLVTIPVELTYKYVIEKSKAITVKA